MLLLSNIDVLIATLLGLESCTAAATAAVDDASTYGVSCTIAAATFDDNDATTCIAAADDDTVISGTCIAASVAEVDETTSMSCLLSFPPLPPFPNNGVVASVIFIVEPLEEELVLSAVVGCGEE